jgi:acetyltransferase-like isoleucine patch superfamily enzyme
MLAVLAIAPIAAMVRWPARRPAGGDSVWMQPPFFCDYGTNIELGERVFFNFNCVVLDECRVQIGSLTLFGPAVQSRARSCSSVLSRQLRRRRCRGVLAKHFPPKPDERRACEPL